MKEIVRRVFIAIGMLAFSLLVVGTVSSLVKLGLKSQSVGTESSVTSSEPTYMGYTRESYLDEVSNNGADAGMLCAYTYLIDTYGLEATAKMDQRAYFDQNDVDERIFEAMEHCL